MNNEQCLSLENNNLQHFALILAAGRSTRMGTCKAGLPWRNNQTLLRYQAEQFLQANIIPIVVLGSHNAQWRSLCPPGSRVVINFQSDRGKISSILTGLNSLPPQFSTITISAVDQPRSSHVYQTLLQSFNREPALIIAPCYQNKLGHPLLFSVRLLPVIKNISDSSLGLRKVVRDYNHDLKKISLDSEVLIDINHRHTYQTEFKKISKNTSSQNNP